MRRAAALACVLCLAAACRTPAPSWMALSPDDPRPVRLLADQVQAAAARRGASARARLAVDGHDGALKLRGAQRVALERPARLRVEVLGLFDQTLAVLVTDGQQYQFFRASDRSWESGPVGPDLLWTHAWIALTPVEAVDLLLGAPRLDPTLSIGGAFADGEGGVRIDLIDAEGLLRSRVRFDAAGRLRGVEAFGLGERRLWRADYGDFELLGGIPFAHDLRLEIDTGDTRADIRLSEVELNPELPPDIFRLRAPAGVGAPGDGG